MENVCGVAFKEWAIVCAAIAEGRQTILLRKGGIDEGRDGFRVKHARFWLYPTQFHQAAEAVQPDAVDRFQNNLLQWGDSGRIRLALWVEVECSWWVDQRERLPWLEPFHVLSPSTVAQRFDYRQPGLHVLAIRAARGACHDLVEEVTFAGCRSWVELPRPLSTDPVVPVLSEAEHAARLDELRRVLTRPLA